MSVRPQRVYDFTAFARRTPNAQLPADRLEAQFNQHADAITAVQLAVEQLIAARVKAEDIDIKMIAAEIKAYALAEFDDIRQQARNAAAVVEVAKFEAARAKVESERARDAADRAEARLAAAVLDAQAAPAPQFSNTPASQAMPSLGYGAGGFYASDDAGAIAVSADYAQVSIAWAEYMAGNATIPPNILAVNAISGDHWSSRWWANRSANAFGMLAWWYQGAWAGAPPTTPNTPTGQPIPIGGLYWDTEANAFFVWNGSTWVNASAPQKGVTASLYYVATANQTIFPLTTVDRFGHNFVFNQTVPEGVQTLINGLRVEPQIDFTVDTTDSIVTLVHPRAAGDVVIFDLLVPALALTPSGSANTLLVSPITPDGTTVTFALTTLATHAPVNTTKSEELLVSVDGVQQQPGGSYTALGANITFTEAPAANSLVFIVWFGPPVVAGGGGSGAVSSVAGRTGDIVLTHADITDWVATLANTAFDAGTF